MSAARALKARNKRIAERGLKPWSEYERGSNDPDFYSESADSWLNNQAAMMSDIDQRLRSFDHVNTSSPVMKRMAGDISSEFGIEFDEAIRNMVRTAKQRGDSPVLSNAVAYGVPAAAADEKMGIAALNLSGFDDPRLLNRESVHATDLQADLNGRTVNVDSQKLVNSFDNFSIGALQNVEMNGPLYQMLSESNAQSVLESLQKLQSASRRQSDGRLRSKGMDVSGAENKLFQSSSSEFNPNPSEFYQNNESLMRKDGLLVSDHSDYSAPVSELRAGPFDSRRPQGMELVDLESLRGLLGQMSLQDLERAGGSVGTHRVAQSRRHFEEDARNRGHRLSDVSLNLPKQFLNGSGGNLGGLSPDALALLTQQLS